VAWERIRGHEALVEGFRRAVRRGRLAHAYLFTGPPGVGKRLFAGELAKALLCECPPAELTACDRCAACVQVEAGTHPDFYPAARPPEALEFPIDLMRQLCAGFALKSARGRGKVIVIDDADDLNEESANCFLKTLEEPPPRSVLILIGSSPERQLPTIVSRCQVVRFAPLPLPVVDEILARRGVEDQALRARLVRLSGGSVAAAEALADPALWEFRRTFLSGLAAPAPDSVAHGRALWDFAEAAGKDSAARRKRAQLVVRLLIDALADALAVALGGEARRSDREDAPTLTALAERVGADGLVELLDRCLDADIQIDRRAQLELVVEALPDALAQRLLAGGAEGAVNGRRPRSLGG
jgi:DNA polymerase-3 subunit delta'